MIEKEGARSEESAQIDRQSGVEPALFVDQDWEAVGRRIETLRGQMSQQEFAEPFGIHRNTLARYESGGRAPDGVFLMALCKRFGVSPSWLLFGIPPRESPTNLEAAALVKAVDDSVLRQMVFAAALETERVLHSKGLHLRGEQKAGLVSAVFELYRSVGDGHFESQLMQLVDAFARIPSAHDPD